MNYNDLLPVLLLLLFLVELGLSIRSLLMKRHVNRQLDEIEKALNELELKVALTTRVEKAKEDVNVHLN